jgi:predicted outer membrane repeat protein
MTYGGALYNYNGSVSINASTFYTNSATSVLSYGGALYSSGGAINITNSSFVDNLAGGDIDSLGGAIYNAGSMTITNATFSGNRAPDGGGAIYNQGANLTLRNTIVANSLGSDNCYGNITNGSGNFSWPADDDSCRATRQDPRLDRLANNGGWTQTMALLPGSAAIHAAVLANCPPTDQRGLPRGWLGQCDSGAFELIWLVFQPVIRK